jgi:hypothetical protein
VDVAISLTSRRWILLVVALTVLAAAGFTARTWYANYRDWHNTKAAPLFSDIEPADGATVFASDAWIRWSSPTTAKGRILWRKAGGLRVQAADGGSGQELLAHLASLSAGSKYEYIVEESDGNQTLRSGVRTLNVKSGLAFEPVIDQSVEHDYDQSVKLTLRNRGSQPVSVAAKALRQFDDLPSDITGYGSVDVPGQVGPNGTLDLRLAVTAADATHDTYEIPVEAAGAYTTARFHVRVPKLNLGFKVNEDPKTLAKTVEIRNNGDVVTDLVVRAVPENQADLEIQPGVNHARLNDGGTINITVTPILYLEFQSLKAEIEATAAGQSAKFQLEFTVPPGVRLIAFRSASGATSSCRGGYCTNNPNTCSTCGGPPGSGPAASSQNTAGDNPETTLLIQMPPMNEEPIRHPPVGLGAAGISLSMMNSFSSPRVIPVSYVSKQTAIASDSFADAGANQAPEQKQDSNTGGEKEPVAPIPSKPYPAGPLECDHYKGSCTRDQAYYCYTKAHELQDRFSDLLAEERTFEKDIEAIFNHCQGYPPVIKCGLGYEFWDQAGLYREKQRFEKELNDVKESLTATAEAYNELRRQCREWCDIHLPALGGTPVPEALNPTREGLPPNFDDLPPDIQNQKMNSWLLSQYFEERAKNDEDCEHAATVIAFPAEGVHLGIPVAALGAGCYAHSGVHSDAAQLFANIALDPPSTQYKEVASAVGPGNLRLPQGSTDLDWLAREAIIAQGWALAYSRAWLTAYERFQGAQAAGDWDSATRQAAALISLSDAKLAASESASLKRVEFESRALATLEAALKPYPAGPAAWEKLVADSRKRIARDGLPSGIREAMAAAGMSPQEISQFQRRHQAMRAEDIEVVLLDWRFETKRQELDRDNPKTHADGYQNSLQVAAALVDQQLSRRLLHLSESARSKMPVAGLGLAGADLRPGLTEALQRRVSFTRLHRGPLAAQLEGASTDSRDFAAAWHIGERVYFAWHQQKDQVIFAAFDRAGKVVSEPQVIGKGRWPRIAAEGNRAAIAWGGPDGSNFVVRVNDGKQWGNEIQLAGKETMVAFAPSGPLYAATSAGLWKLNGERFDRVQEANYSQPAVAVDKEGKPHVAWHQNGHIVYDGSDVGEGERPSVVIAPDGTLNLAYISKGALVIRSGKGGQWTAPDTIPAKNPSWPTLALDSNGGVRLSYIGAADYGPDALYLVRLPDKQSILMPSLAGNVTDAWLTTEFDLHSLRSYYRPHDLLLTVNDVWVKMFENTVPEGRYLFRLNPYQVFTSPGKPVPNRVAIHSWHMNPGHYSSSSGYGLGVRMAWSEHYVFAASDEEARRTITSERVNHDQPDLGIFTNAMNLPIEQPKPGRVDMPVLIANLGEATSSPVRLLMISELGETLAAAQVPPLKPGAETTIAMSLNYDGKLAEMGELTFRLENNHDFDPSNDSLTLLLWGPKPTGYEGPEPGLPKVPLELMVKIANAPEPPARYQIVDAFSKRMIAKVENGTQFGPLRTGTYRVAVQQYPYEGQEVLFTDNIEHQAGVAQTVQLDSGIKVDSSESTGPIWQWSAVEAGNPEKVVQRQTIQHPVMALPPGEYQLAVQADEYYGRPLVWLQKIIVRPHEVFTVKLGSGIRLEVPKEVGAPDLWQVVKFGKPDDVVQWHRGDRRLVTPLPPDEYQFVAKPDEYYSQRLVWPQKIVVQPDQLFTLKLGSGIRLEVPKEVGAPDLWQVVKFGKPDDVVQWHRGDRRLVTPLPPDEYQFVAKPDEYYSQRLVWPQKIVVQPDQLFTLKLTSGIRLEIPRQVGTPDLWEVVAFGKPDQALQWHRGDRRIITPLPAGEYQVGIRADQYYGRWLVWPQKIQVQPDQVVTIKLNSGIRMVGPAGVGPDFEFEVLSERKQVALSGRGSWKTQLLPSGNYSLQIRRPYGQWRTVAEQVQVREGQVTDVRISELPHQ